MPPARRGDRLARPLRPPRLPDDPASSRRRDVPFVHLARRRRASRSVGRAAGADHRARLVGVARHRRAGVHGDRRTFAALLRARRSETRNATLWSSLVLRSDKHRVFFSGDTGLTTEYEEIRARLGPFDLVMLEIGAFHPAWGDMHLGPGNALKAHALLGGGAFLPVHWGTFSLAMHAWDQPAGSAARDRIEGQRAARDAPARRAGGADARRCPRGSLVAGAGRAGAPGARGGFRGQATLGRTVSPRLKGLIRQ